MRVLLAFDKFKDSLTAREACDITARALGQTHSDWTLDLCPLADGGEGFCEILTESAGGRMVVSTVNGPRGEVREVSFGIVPLAGIPATARTLLALPETPGHAHPTVAVIEMAAASGLALLFNEQRDPWQTTSFGTGELIRAATEHGVSAVLLGVGGSATHDLGLGALAALGVGFDNARGERIDPPIPARWQLTFSRGFTDGRPAWSLRAGTSSGSISRICAGDSTCRAHGIFNWSSRMFSRSTGHNFGMRI